MTEVKEQEQTYLIWADVWGKLLMYLASFPILQNAHFLQGSNCSTFKCFIWRFDTLFKYGIDRILGSRGDSLHPTWVLSRSLLVLQGTTSFFFPYSETPWTWLALPINFLRMIIYPSIEFNCWIFLANDYSAIIASCFQKWMYYMYVCV